MKNFWVGFEKQASLIGGIVGAGRSAAKWGSNLAKGTGTGFLDQAKRTVGSAVEAGGKFVTRNPGVTAAGLGAGLGAGGALAAHKIMQ